MAEIVAEDQPFVRHELDAEEAATFFADDMYKAEIMSVSCRARRQVKTPARSPTRRQ